MPEQDYGWINFYMEFATELLTFKEKRNELIQKIKTIYDNIGMKLPKLESDNNPRDIDPFTIYGLFNKGTQTSHIPNKPAIMHSKGM